MTFRAAATGDSAGLASVTATLAVPGAVATGDVGFLLVTWVGTAGETPPTCTAESAVGNAWSSVVPPTTSNNMGFAVLTRKAAAADAATVTITTGGARLTTFAAVWQSGVSGTGVVGAVSARGGVSGTTTTAPSITAGAAGRTALAFFAERTTATGTTAGVNAGTVRAYLEGAGASTGSALIAELTTSAAVTGDVVATYSGAGSGNGAGVQIELLPVAAPPAPGDSSAPGFAEGFSGGFGPTVVITPPDPPGPPPPVPAPAGTPGRSKPPVWTWVTGSWRTGPDLALRRARNRRVTWRRTGRHEASFDLDGQDPAALALGAEPELVDDLWLIRSTAPGLGRTLFRGRIGVTGDEGDADSQSVTVTAGDYREVLRRRQLWEGGQLSWPNTEQSLIAWGLVQHTQSQTGGQLGIVRGVGQVTNVYRVVADFAPGKSIGESLDQLGSQLNGFDWDITPHPDPRNRTLYLDLFSPARGTDRGVVLDYGGRVVKFTRQFDPGQYANAIRGTGADSTSTGGTLAPVRQEAADLATRPEGRWDGEVSDTDITAQSFIVSRTGWELEQRQVRDASWTVTLRPDGWGGPEDIWLGDTVKLVVRSGRLDVVQPQQVQEIAASWDDNDTVTATLTLGRTVPPGRQWTPRRFDQRIHALERR